MKKINRIIISFIFILIIGISYSYADDGIYINNYKIPKSTPISIKNDKAFISTNDLATILGGTVTWDNKTKSATIKTDTTSFQFTNNSDVAKLNGDNIKIELKPFIEKGKLMVPATVIRDFYNYKISWNYKTRNFLINSDEKSLKDKPVYSSKTIMPIIEKTVGEDFNSFNFTYALTDEIKNEKYLPNGTYFIFKANEKGNVTKTLNGFFYMNAYTNEIFYYPLETKDTLSNMKKYSNGAIIENFNINKKNNIHSLVATTKMINSIKQTDNALSQYSYSMIDKINSEYLKHIPKATYYYYQASKKENDKLKPQFEIAQNANTLEVYLFLKKENGINIVKLPDYKLIKTINLKK